MKLWIGAETQSDVGEKLRVKMIEIEKIILEKISEKDYNIPLTKWRVIIILMEKTSWDERIKYSPKKMEMDFRLNLDYSTFVKATDEEIELMIFNLLLRSLQILKDKWIKEKGIDLLIADVMEVGRTQGWTN